MAQHDDVSTWHRLDAPLSSGLLVPAVAAAALCSWVDRGKVSYSDAVAEEDDVVPEMVVFQGARAQYHSGLALPLELWKQQHHR